MQNMTEPTEKNVDKIDKQHSGCIKMLDDEGLRQNPTQSLPQDDKVTRSSLQLPSEENIMWIEKYRPQTFGEIADHHAVLETLKKLVESQELPHILLEGPPGTGKTSTILAMARHLYRVPAHKPVPSSLVLELNASDERGIEMVRNQIKNFASSSVANSLAAFFTQKHVISNEPFKSTTQALPQFKLIILDEADQMTSVAQFALRRIMEQYASNVRFCLIANYSNKIIPALHSRCRAFSFLPLTLRAVEKTVGHIAKQENFILDQGALPAIYNICNGDMRKCINILQSCVSSLAIRQQHHSNNVVSGTKDINVKANEISSQAGINEIQPIFTITSTVIHDVTGLPTPDHIKHVLHLLLLLHPKSNQDPEYDFSVQLIQLVSDNCFSLPFRPAKTAHQAALSFPRLETKTDHNCNCILTSLSTKMEMSVVDAHPASDESIAKTIEFKFSKLFSFIRNEGLSMTDLLSGLSAFIMSESLFMSHTEKFCTLIQNLASSESRLAAGSSEKLEIGALIGAFYNFVSLSLSS